MFDVEYRTFKQSFFLDRPRFSQLKFMQFVMIMFTPDML